MKLLLVIGTLGGAGGAERACALLAGGLAACGHAVELLTLHGDGRDFYPVDPAVRRRHEALIARAPSRPLALLGFLRIQHRLRRLLRDLDPDVVVSFMEPMNVRCGLALRGRKRPFHVASVQNDPWAHSYGFPWRVLRRMVYPYIDRVVSVGHSCNAALHWVPTARRDVIYNPLSPEFTARSGPPRPRTMDPRFRWILSVGRLAPQKGQDLLVDALAEVANRHCGWRLALVGEGPERTALEARIARHGLRDRVVLAGLVRDLPAWYDAADLFVLPSRHEGLPGALVEAMARGLAVIATDCPSGPAELVVPEQSGLLVPVDDVPALAGALSRLMDDEALRRQLGSASTALRRSVSLENVAARWDSLLRGLVAAGGRASDEGQGGK